MTTASPRRCGAATFGGVTMLMFLIAVCRPSTASNH